MTLSNGFAPYVAKSEGLLWTYLKGDNTIKEQETGADIISYGVSQEILYIAEGYETIFIDYEHHRFHRYRKSDNSCESFALTNPASAIHESTSEEEIARQRMINLLGSFKVINIDEHMKIKNYNCLKKSILFAYDLSFFQMIVSPVIKQFGQIFTESMVTYWVTRDIAAYDNLVKIAEKHKDIYSSNPLLRQIDILGIIVELDGFPINIEKTIQKNIDIYTLLSIENIEEINNLFIIPEICKKY